MKKCFWIVLSVLAVALIALPALAEESATLVGPEGELFTFTYMVNDEDTFLYPTGDYVETAQVGDLTFTLACMQGRWCYQLDNGMRYFASPISRDVLNVALFPHTVEEVRLSNSLHQLADLKNGYLTSHWSTWSDQKKLSEKNQPVYSSPFAEGLRGGKGKAAVNLPSGCFLLGECNGATLIRYAVTEERDRVGYVLGTTQDTWDSPFAIDLRAAIHASAAPGSMLTDDPYKSHEPLAAAPQEVDVLAMDATIPWYAYVAAEVGGQQVWGFVPVKSLTIGTELAESIVYYDDVGLAQGHDYEAYVDEGNYVLPVVMPLFEVNELIFDDQHQVCAVRGSYETMAIAQESMSVIGGPVHNEFVYPLAEDFSAYMIDDNSAESHMVVTDLRAWWEDVYLNHGEDVGEDDFWFFTVRLELNEKQEVSFMSYVHVPWA